jgi:hypothetical protein
MKDRSQSAVRPLDMSVLDRLGVSLRKATEAVLAEELPEDIQRLLRKLEQRGTSEKAASDSRESAADR